MTVLSLGAWVAAFTYFRHPLSSLTGTTSHITSLFIMDPLARPLPGYLLVTLPFVRCVVLDLRGH